MTTTDRRPLGTRIRLIAGAVALAILAPLAVAATPTTASAAPKAKATSTCRTYQRNWDQRVSKLIVAEGWGLTMWRVKPHAWITDNCTSGRISVSAAVYDANVTAKGGKLVVQSVSYKTNKLSSWARLGLVQSWPTATFSLPRGCMEPGERVTAIKVVTAVYGRASAGGWVGLASNTNTFTVS